MKSPTRLFVRLMGAASALAALIAATLPTIATAQVLANSAGGVFGPTGAGTVTVHFRGTWNSDDNPNPIPPVGRIEVWNNTTNTKIATLSFSHYQSSGIWTSTDNGTARDVSSSVINFWGDGPRFGTVSGYWDLTLPAGTYEVKTFTTTTGSGGGQRQAVSRVGADGVFFPSPSITITSLSTNAATFNGAAQSPSFNVSPSGAQFTYNIDGSGTTRTDAGTYTVYWTAGSGYAGSGTAQWIIQKANQPSIPSSISPAAVTFGGSINSSTFTAAAGTRAGTPTWQYRTSSSGSWTNLTSTNVAVGNAGSYLGVRVVYDGGTNYNSSTSNEQIVTINKANQTIPGGITPTTLTYRGMTPSTFTATTGTRVGTMSWQYRTSSSGSWLPFSYFAPAAGSYFEIRVTYAGNTNYNAATSNGQVITITKAPRTVVAYGRTAYLGLGSPASTLTLSAWGAEGTPTFSIISQSPNDGSGTGMVSLSGSTATFSKAGEFTFRASYPETTNYLAGSGDGIVDVRKGNPRIQPRPLWKRTWYYSYPTWITSGTEVTDGVSAAYFDAWSSWNGEEWEFGEDYDFYADWDIQPPSGATYLGTGFIFWAATPQFTYEDGNGLSIPLSGYVPSAAETFGGIWAYTLTSSEYVVGAAPVITSGNSFTVGGSYTATASGGSGDGSYTWSLAPGSTAPGASINASTGQVSASGAGTVIIRVRRAATVNYEESAFSAPHTITVSSANQPPVVSFTFSGATANTGATVDAGIVVAQTNQSVSVSATDPNGNLSKVMLYSIATDHLLVGYGEVVDIHWGLDSTKTIGELSLQTTLPGWVSTPTATRATADYLARWTGVSWQMFYFDTDFGFWRLSTDFGTTDRGSIAINADTPIRIIRRGSNLAFDNPATLLGLFGRTAIPASPTWGAYSGAGSYRIRLAAIDTNGATSTATITAFAKYTQAPTSVTSGNSVTYGNSYTATASNSGLNTPHVWSLGVGSTAPGAAINSSTGVVTTRGTGTVVIRAYQTGTSHYFDADTSPDFTVTVSPRPVTLTIGGSKIHDGTTIATGATAVVTAGSLAPGDSIGPFATIVGTSSPNVGTYLLDWPIHAGTSLFVTAPSATTLGALGIENTPGFVRNTGVLADADKVRLFDGAAWREFNYNQAAAQWREGSTTFNRSTFAIPAGRDVWILKADQAPNVRSGSYSVTYAGGYQITSGFNLTVTSDAGGSASGSATGLAGDAVVAISATPASGYTFVHWSGDAVANRTSPSTTIAMNSANRSVQANFIETASVFDAGTVVFDDAVPVNAALQSAGYPATTSVRTARVSNSGNIALNIESALVGGAFSHSSTVPFLVQPGHQAEIVTTFAPTALGESSSTMVFLSNDQPRRAYRFLLVGTGRDPRSAPSSTISTDAASVPAGTPIALTLSTNDVSGTLTAQRIDYMAPGSGTWTTGTVGAGTAWSGTTTAKVRVFPSLIPGALTTTTGVWQFRGSATNSHGTANSNTISVTVTAAPTPAAATGYLTSNSADLNTVFGRKLAVGTAGATQFLSGANDLNLAFDDISVASENFVKALAGRLVFSNAASVATVAVGAGYGGNASALHIPADHTRAGIDFVDHGMRFVNGMAYSWGFWARTNSGSRTIHVGISDDGESGVSTAAHTVDTTWRWVSVSKTFTSAGSRPRLYFNFNGPSSASIVQVSHPTLVRGGHTGYQTPDGRDLVFLFSPFGSN